MSSIEPPPTDGPSAEELARIDALERSAVTGVTEGLVRPTRPPFAWAEPMFTIGITGTNGKSSTTHLIAAALRAAGHSVLLESTLGYWLDDRKLEVARTSRGYASALKHASAAGCRHAAVEVTSAALAHGFARIWRYDLGVFTNLSRDHIEAHGSWEHYLASKAQLFVHLGPGRSAVLNACDPAALLIERVMPPDVRRRFFAVESRGPRLVAADLEAREVNLSASGTRIALEPSELAEALGGELVTRLVGQVFAENALAAALAAISAGVPAQKVREGIRACPVVPGRFEVVAGDPIVAVDYAHTPDALARTCDAARALAAGHRVIVVFGAGGGADRPKRGPMGRAVGERAELAIVTSDNPRDDEPSEIAREVAAGCRRGGRAHVQIELDRTRAIERALAAARPGDVLVIAGKGHERGQTVRGVTHPFSDREEVERLLGSRGAP